MSEATMKTDAVSQAVAMLEGRAMFYRPPDIEGAFKQWRASCGPCALAALMQRPVMSVKEFFPEFPGYTNGKTMLRALEMAGLSSTMEVKGPAWPDRGLCWIGFKGPWSVMPFHIRIKYSHWVAVQTIAGSTVVWDVNVNAWAHKSVWERAVLPELLEKYKKATGEYEVFRGIEIKG